MSGDPGPSLDFIGGDWELEVDTPVAVDADNVARIGATAFDGWGDESELPTRQWLYGTHLIRGRVSLDVAAGGIGKTAVKVGEALAMAAGRPLYNKPIYGGPLRVWLYNLEDDMDELTLRLRAAAKFHRVDRREIGDRLYVNSGLDQPVIVATQLPSGAAVALPVVEALIAEIRARKIDVLIVDPFVSSHAVSENDNNAIDLVVKRAWVRIAYETQCAVNLVHHIRKGNGEDATADSARGASSLIGAARSVQVFNRMSEAEAQQAGVPPEKRRFHFRVTNEKANLAPPPDRADWYRMENCDLDNGEKVGVAAQFVWPAPQDAVSPERKFAALQAIRAGEWRASSQSKQWVGLAIGDAIDVDMSEPEQVTTIKGIIKAWLKDGTLKAVERQDSRREMRQYIEVVEVQV